ncbi:MAG: heat-inducible transcriptional repressor HrcA [Alphaproteobacteria bacterium]
MIDPQQRTIERTLESGRREPIDDRSRQILRHIVDAYVETGAPIGSRTISRSMGMTLSPATIRNVMADLEDAGLLYAPHTSAGRLPTEAGLRLFVDGILQVGQLSEQERTQIEASFSGEHRTLQNALEGASQMLSGLAACAGLVVAPKLESPLKQLEFVTLGPGRALVVMVHENGQVENRVIDLPQRLPMSSLIEAANYLNARLAGRTIGEALSEIELELTSDRAELDVLTRKVVAAGLACWSDDGSDDGLLIVRGQANLLEDVTALDDLHRIRRLFQALERKRSMLEVLRQTGSAEGVRIFIGAENELFDHAGCSLIIAPFRNGRAEVVGAIGVIGPTRLNYARIIPVVDYTAQVIGRLLPGGHGRLEVDPGR